MAVPMTPGQMLAALKAEGVKVAEWSGWRDRCRCHSGSHERGVGSTGRPWGSMHGVMIHHTGSDSQSDDYVRNVLASGYTGLPGPLCHAGGRMDGTVVLVGSGRANHAGGGDPAVLAKVIAESYTSLKPAKGNSNGTDGNRHFYGLEVMYDGGQPMTAAQLDGAVRYAAAICRHHGWSAKSVIGHGEWSSDKWDPGQQSMGEFRRLVQARLDGAASGAEPPGGDEFDMASLSELRQVVREEVGRGAPRAEMKSHTSLDGGVVAESVAAAIRRAQTIGRQNRAKLNRIEKKLDSVVAALKKSPQAAAALGPAVFDIAAAVAEVDASDVSQEQGAESLLVTERDA